MDRPINEEGLNELVNISIDGKFILPRDSFPDNMLYYKYLTRMLVNSFDNEREKIGRILINRIKEENILMNMLRDYKGSPMIQALVRTMVFYIENVAMLIKDQEQLNWIINMLKNNLEFIWNIDHVYIILLNASRLNALDIVTNTLTDVGIDMLKLLLAMRHDKFSPRTTVSEVFKIMYGISNKIDINELMKAYNEGKGTNTFRLWFGNLIMNQV